MANPIFSSVGTYVEQNTPAIVGKIVLSIPHIKDFSLMPNVKGGQVQLNILTSAPLIEDGTTCVTEGGTATFTKRLMDAANLQVNTPYCFKQMLPYWAGLKVKNATTVDEDLAEAFMNAEITKINKEMERRIWQGAKATDEIDGVATIAAAEGEEVTPSAGATLYQKVNQVRLAAQSAGVTDIVIALGADNYFGLVDELVSKNLFHYTAIADGQMEFTFPGTNVKVWGINGLNAAEGGTSYVLAFEPENIFYGFDENPGIDQVRWAVDEVNDTAHFKADWVAGVQIADPSRVYFAEI